MNDKKITEFTESLALTNNAFIPIVQGNPVNNYKITPDNFIESKDLATKQFVTNLTANKLNDAPSNDILYGRKNATWEEIPSDLQGVTKEYVDDADEVLNNSITRLTATVGTNYTSLTNLLNTETTNRISDDNATNLLVSEETTNRIAQDNILVGTIADLSNNSVLKNGNQTISGEKTFNDKATFNNVLINGTLNGNGSSLTGLTKSQITDFPAMPSPSGSTTQDFNAKKLNLNGTLKIVNTDNTQIGYPSVGFIRHNDDVYHQYETLAYTKSFNIDSYTGTDLNTPGGTYYNKLRLDSNGFLFLTSNIVKSNVLLSDASRSPQAGFDGLMQYIKTSNSSSVQVMMQTGASTYEWVTIMTKTW